jgi:Ran GTPase-activating protein (RanGAP) involved in mRNA processing and transport
VDIISLTFLDLSGNDLTTDGFPTISPFVMKQSQLTQLLLDDNELEDEGAEAVASVLSDTAVLPQLTNLSVTSNEIGNDGAKAIVTALKGRTKLASLLMNSNKISESQIEALTKILELQVTICQGGG